MATLKQLLRKNPHYTAKHEYWSDLDMLHRGGKEFTKEARLRLLSNPDGRDKQVMEERLKVARYFNKISPQITRFVSQLFQEPAVFTPDGNADTKFWETFREEGALLSDDEDGRCSVDNFLKEALTQALVTQRAIAQIELPPSRGSTNKAQQRKNGELDPYLLLHPCKNMWDWKTSREGFQFAKLHQFSYARETWDSDPIPVHYFSVYQRRPDKTITFSKYSVRERQRDPDKGFALFALSEAHEKKYDVRTEQEDELLYSSGGEYRFPIVTLALPSQLWIADQLFEPQVSHFNQTAGIEWALMQSNYSMPWVRTDDSDDFRDRNQKHGAGFMLWLAKDEEIGRLDAPNTEVKTSMDYREVIDNDIEATLQKVALSARDMVQTKSGEAIKQSQEPMQILLEVYGAKIRSFAKQVYETASIAHDEVLTWKIKGYTDFDDIDLNTIVTGHSGVKNLQIQSQTLQKEMDKGLASTVGQIYRFAPETMKKIDDEIENAPDPDQLGEVEVEDAEPELTDEEQFVDELLR